MKSPIYLVALTLSFIFVVSCSHFGNNKVDSIQIISESKANYNSKTDIDIVFVFDGSVQIPETNEKWFDVHNDLRFNGQVKVVSLHLPPSLISEVQMPGKHYSAIKVLAFVNFKKNGDQPPLNLTKNKNPVIILKDDNYQLSWRR